MQFINTLSRNKENFKPLKEEKVKVYYCGPTPYNYAHIGNLRTYLFEDIVVKTLRFLGYKIETAMNITDIDDKTIRDSIKEGVTLKELTTKYIDIFFEDLEKLNIQKADNISPISELIDEMVVIINGLFEKGYAYLAPDGSVYYSISKFKKYGELANLDFSGMKSSVRIDNDEYDKEQAADFALWKAYSPEKDGPNKWEARFKINGDEVVIWGRPGWHIECSACNLRFFGQQIDLHMGAIDLIFPHHQNEIAQSEAYTGKQFSKYWLHMGHVLVDNKKMSKSLGNFFTLRDLEEKAEGMMPKERLYRGFRLMNLQSKYSESFNFTFDKLKQASETLSTFDELLKRIRNTTFQEGKVTKSVSFDIQTFVQEYISELEDDFNTPEALAVVFDFVSYVNSGLDKELFTDREISAVMDVLKTFDQILGILDFSLLEKIDVPEEIKEMIEKRNQAKLDKDYATADELRKAVESRGYKIIDDRNGSHAEKI